MAEPLELRHEPDAVDARRIALGAAGLLAVVAGCIAVSALLMNVYARGYGRAPARIPTALPPTAGVALEPDAIAALARFRKEKSALLEGYAWVDRAHGVVRIPIEEAMRIVASRNGGGAGLK